MTQPACRCAVCAPSDEPSPFARRDAQIVDNVRAYGWHVMGVGGGDGPADWAYSIGMGHSLGRPDLCIFGLPLDIMMPIINDAGAVARDERPLAPGEHRDEILNGYDVFIGAVHPTWYRAFFGAGLDFYNHQPAPMLQMFWPDRDGRFPWDQGVGEYCGDSQPLLWVPRNDSTGPWPDAYPVS